MVTRIYQVFGKDGHRQRESFNRSCAFATFHRNSVITVYNSDITYSNDFSIVVIMARDAETCEDELDAQLSDGIFENSEVGRVLELDFLGFQEIFKG